MVVDDPNWRDGAAQFLAENLPKASDRPGWNDMASTAYQIGCSALVRLGYADATDGGATPRSAPEQPETAPRWDDICISVLWLARQQNKLSYRLPDGRLPPARRGKGLFIAPNDPPPPLNIAARFGLGCAFGEPDLLRVAEQLGLVADGGWAERAELLLWRTSPENWSLEFRNDTRFLEAAQRAVATMPDDIAAEIFKLTAIGEDQIDEFITRHQDKVAEFRERYGPTARMSEAPSREQARRSLEFTCRNALDWVFFRRWRIGDGWLSAKGAEAALGIFHDRLAISMRRSVLQQLLPQKPQYFQ